MSRADYNIISELVSNFGGSAVLYEQMTMDGTSTIWTDRSNLVQILKYLKNEITLPFRMLYDLTCIDERIRNKREGQPASDFSVVYHLTSFDRNQDIRIKVALKDEDLNIPSITTVWESANWYEREVFDMFGINFTGHPKLSRILMPKSWKGHPLRKEHPARATELDPFVLTDIIRDEEDSNLKFSPEEYGLTQKVRTVISCF